MGAEQSQEQQSQNNKSGLAGFCCNKNLCNNDSNIDNKMTEINRKNAYRNMMAGQNRVSQREGMLDPIKSYGSKQYEATSEQFNSSNLGAYDQSVLPNPQLRDQVKNALSIPGNQSKNQMQKPPQYNKNQFDDMQKPRNAPAQNTNLMIQDNSTINTVQTISPQSQFQNEIQTNLESLIMYKKRLNECAQNRSYPDLNLEVISSATLTKGQIITLNPWGLCPTEQFQSLRQMHQQVSHNDIEAAPDGFTYFGSMAEVYDEDQEDMPTTDNNNQAQALVVNDFVIPSRNQQSAEQHRGRHFQIWFDTQPQSMGFFIKDLGIGFGVFKKMDTYGMDPSATSGSIDLKDNMLVNVGEAYIVVNLLPEGLDDEGPHHTLKLKIFGGSNNGEIYEFHVNQMMNGQREIIMGRTPECDIKINDKLLSKSQSHIKLEFLSDGSYRWVLHDGYNGKPSTNGTWLYINEDMLIYDDMIFKANQTIFSVSF